MNRMLLDRGVAVIAIAFAIAFFAWSRQRVWSYSQLEPACEARTRELLVADGATPTEWMPVMSSTLGDVLNLYGRWRVGQQHVDVLCTARRGKQIEDIGWEIGYPQ